MNDTVVDALILDLLRYVSERERTYEEALDAWRTSCPRLPVWEEASERGFVESERAGGRRIVRLTAAGEKKLSK
jgi:D-3-phosphoglycerate dehydrogenase